MLTISVFLLGSPGVRDVSGFIVRVRFAATLIGLLAFLVGLYAQLVSNTGEQRVLVGDEHDRRVPRAGLSASRTAGFSLHG